MPRKSGIEAIEEIKQENPDARILVLTSYSDDEKVFAAIKAGALGYLLRHRPKNCCKQFRMSTTVNLRCIRPN